MNPESDFEPSIRTWLIEDNVAFRNAVSRVLNQAGGIECDRIFPDVESALPALKEGNPPDVILLDVDLPGMSGLDAVGRIKRTVPDTQIVMVTVSDDHAKISKALCGGASGYLLKSASMDKIVEAVRDVVAGGVPMTPQVARSVLELLPRPNPTPQDLGLTTREHEVLELMRQGLVKKEIADRLSLSFHTVDTHLRSIYAKLQVNTRSGAVAKALDMKLF